MNGCEVAPAPRCDDRRMQWWQDMSVRSPESFFPMLQTRWSMASDAVAYILPQEAHICEHVSMSLRSAFVRFADRSERRCTCICMVRLDFGWLVFKARVWRYCWAAWTCCLPLSLIGNEQMRLSQKVAALRDQCGESRIPSAQRRRTVFEALAIRSHRSVLLARYIDRGILARNWRRNTFLFGSSVRPERLRYGEGEFGCRFRLKPVQLQSEIMGIFCFEEEWLCISI